MPLTTLASFSLRPQVSQDVLKDSAISEVF